MKRVTGIGGVFFKAKDAPALQAWYTRHLGINVQAWGGAAFDWNDSDGKPTGGTTAWTIAPEGSNQFAPSSASFMINYRVDDLHAIVAALKADCAPSSTRSMILSTASLPGSSTLREIRSNCGSHRPVNEFPPRALGSYIRMSFGRLNMETLQAIGLRKRRCGVLAATEDFQKRRDRGRPAGSRTPRRRGALADLLSVSRERIGIIQQCPEVRLVSLEGAGDRGRRALGEAGQ
jgi:hypothetical protein